MTALVISGSTSDYNVYDAYVAANGTPPASAAVTVTVNTGVVVSATTTATAALTFDNRWTGTPTFTLLNNGSIIGKGGAGGAGGVEGDSSAPGDPGLAGGKAIELNGNTVTITNASGFIWGGGGGGGGGAGGNLITLGEGGGGGGGVRLGLGGIGGDGFGSGPEYGTDATATVPGVGGASGGSSTGGGAGGNGADFGVAGSNGSSGSGGSGGDGGAAGRAINLTGGTPYFVSGMDSPNVKGVSGGVAAPTDGIVTTLSGSVTKTNASGTSALSQGDGVSEGDTITTSGNGVTTLTMGDGTLLVCQPDTVIHIDDYSYTPLVVDTNSLWVRVTQGIVRAVSGAINTIRPSAFRVITPQTVFGVRGTNFTVTVTSTGTVLTVTSGTVLATSGSQTYTVNAGESMSFPLGAPPVVLGEAVTSLPLPAGKYQVALTYLRNDGQESGACRATTIDLTANGGISLSAIPVSTDPTVTHKAIYLTPVNGETLYRVGVIPNADTTFVVREIRKGASPLLTQFLSAPPAGDHIAYANGLMLVAKGARLYPSESYAPELFDLRKAIPFTDRIAMVAPVKDGVWIGTDSQIIWLAGNLPEKWDFKVAAEYGCIRGTLTFNDSELIGDGSAGGEIVAFFASKRGLRVGHLGGRLINLDRDRFAYPIQERGAGIVRRHRGIAQFVVTMQGAETAGNVAA